MHIPVAVDTLTLSLMQKPANRYIMKAFADLETPR